MSAAWFDLVFGRTVVSKMSSALRIKKHIGPNTSMIKRILQIVRHLWLYRASNGTLSALKHAKSLIRSKFVDQTENRRLKAVEEARIRSEKFPDIPYHPPSERAGGNAVVMGDIELARQWATDSGLGGAISLSFLTTSDCAILNPHDALERANLLIFSFGLSDVPEPSWSNCLKYAWERGLPTIGVISAELFEQLANDDTFAVISADRAGRDDLAAKPFSIVEFLQWCDFYWTSRTLVRDIFGASGPTLQPQGSLTELTNAFRKLRLPKVSIIGILYRKREEIGTVLNTYAYQNYPGELEFILVDDCSPDDSSQLALETHQRLVQTGLWPARFSIRIVTNESNSGNCVSRNTAIDLATGEILVIIDADCAINPGFVAAHVAIHAIRASEIVLGPMNIESNGQSIASIFESLEGKPEAALSRARLQDSQNLPAFVNCITRNFSVRKQWLLNDFKQPLFDPLFGYSADPESGFGWEDVEAGYRLYLAGARVGFTVGALSVHVSPVVIYDDATRPKRSLLNFRRLHEKHPQLHRVARLWSVETFHDICTWADLVKSNCEPDRAWLNLHLRSEKTPLFHIRKDKPLRVLTYRWHVPHQFELYKLPFDFTLVTGLGTGWTEHWEFEQRPMPLNAKFVDWANVKPRDYDLAILHFDENTLRTDLTQGVIDPSWSLPLLHFLKNVDIPKVAICHGTPQFHGQYTPGYSGPDLMQPVIESRAELVNLLRGVPVVCNSYQAEAEWGFADSRTIWHGLDGADFPLTTYQRGIISPLGALVTTRPHYRGYYLYQEVFNGYYDKLGPHRLRVPRPHPVSRGNPAAYAWMKYRNYVDVLRQYSIYFNPTLRSPMPRARTEPMMCGVVPVSASNHDVKHFIQNGVNGFHSNDPNELRDYLFYLMKSPKTCRTMGSEARATALKEFNIDRFVGSWQQLARSTIA